jgi:hypothetical protein
VSGTVPAVPDDLERIATFRRWTENVTSSSVGPWRFGTALYRDDFPNRWDSNFLRVEGGGGGGGGGGRGGGGEGKRAETPPP